MTRYLTAIREAWWTFRLSLLGWRVESYTLPVWPGFGRCAGSIYRWEPTYKDVAPRDYEHGWGLSSHGESYPERWPTPLDAVQPNPRMTTIQRRTERLRSPA